MKEPGREAPPPRDGGAGASIRRASPSDLEAIVGLRIDFERITRDSGSMDEEARREELRSLLGPDLASGALAAWIAEAGGRAVGQAGLLIGPRAGGRAARRFELLNLYVEPGFRGRGVGTALVEAAIAEAASRGAASIRLQPTEDSRRIYERAGFKLLGRRMILDLGASPGL
jgi:GNAT superfamily N-acetyltransferase